MADDDNDDFVDIERGSTKPVPGPVVMKTIAMRGGAERVSITFSPEAIAKLEGWPRFSVAWSAARLMFRIRADPSGAYEACRTPKGDRYMLRFPLPKEARLVPKQAEPAPHVYEADGRTMMVTLPLAFRRPRTHAEMQVVARLAVPAPKFK